MERIFSNFVPGADQAQIALGGEFSEHSLLVLTHGPSLAPLHLNEEPVVLTSGLWDHEIRRSAYHAFVLETLGFSGFPLAAIRNSEKENTREGPPQVHNYLYLLGMLRRY